MLHFLRKCVPKVRGAHVTGKVTQSLVAVLLLNMPDSQRWAPGHKNGHFSWTLTGLQGQIPVCIPGKPKRRTYWIVKVALRDDPPRVATTDAVVRVFTIGVGIVTVA